MGYLHPRGPANIDTNISVGQIPIGVWYMHVNRDP